MAISTSVRKRRTIIHGCPEKLALSSREAIQGQEWPTERKCRTKANKYRNAPFSQFVDGRRVFSQIELGSYEHSRNSRCVMRDLGPPLFVHDAINDAEANKESEPAAMRYTKEKG